MSELKEYLPSTQNNNVFMCLIHIAFIVALTVDNTTPPSMIYNTYISTKYSSGR